MGPEAEPRRVCHCPGDGPRRPPPPYAPESLSLGVSRLCNQGGLRVSASCKRQEYLQSSGEQVLASFPVQATIHFYNDESDSDEEAGELEEGAQEPTLQGQQAGGPRENGPGGACRAQLVSGGERPRGQPPHQEPSREGVCTPSQ